MRLRKPGRDDTDDFFVIPFKPCVNNEEHHPRCDGSQAIPSLLILKHRVMFSQNVGIIEDKNCSLEANIMLP